MSKLLFSGEEPHFLDLLPRGHINLKEEVSDVFSFSEEETRGDSLEHAGIELQVWRQKILLITDQVIYEVWGSILHEPVVRQADLTLEKCLLRASSLGDKQRDPKK